MLRFLSTPPPISRCVTAMVAGLLLSAAFPKWDIAGAAWVAPGLLLFSALGVTGRQAFTLGFLGGLSHALASLSWLLNIPYTFHGLPLAPALGWFALSCYVALYFASWVWLCWKLFQWRGDAATFGTFATHNGLKRALWAFLCAAVWVALEMIRARFLSGFPWNPLGASQYRLLPLIQVASIGGVYAVAFLVVWTSVAIAAALTVTIFTPSTRRSVLPGVFSGTLVRDSFAPLLAVALAVSFGMHHVFAVHPSKSELKVALIQPSIPQTLIWDSNANAERFQKVISLSKQALAQKPDMLVWPESSLPETTEENVTALANLAKSNHVWIILCADDREVTPGQPSKYYNASFFISPEGRAVGRYHKNRLVIFGEYVPLIRWLPFLQWFTPIDGGFTPGEGPVPFRLTQPEAEVSVLICFEDVFPQEARRHATPSTDFLINLTNDGWFGEGAAQWQQAAAALFRAIENGIPLVRCTNNGLTCWIDEVGRIHQMEAPNGIYGEGFQVAKIPLQPVGGRELTFYNRFGDLFGWACVGLVAAACGWAWMKHRREKYQTNPSA